MMNALKRKREIEPDSIDVTVEDHHVTLSGSVRNEDTRTQIKKTAMFTDSVTGVQDNLVLKYPEL